MGIELIRTVRDRYREPLALTSESQALLLPSTADFLRAVCTRWEHHASWIEEHFENLRSEPPVMDERGRWSLSCEGAAPSEFSDGSSRHEYRPPEMNVGGADHPGQAWKDGSTRNSGVRGAYGRSLHGRARGLPRQRGATVPGSSADTSPSDSNGPAARARGSATVCTRRTNTLTTCFR